MIYDKMSDFEINKAVAVRLDLINIGKSSCGSDSAIEHSECNWSPRPLYKRLDYCNNPSDAWPIIVGNLIDIEWPEKDLGGIGAAHKYMWGATDIQVEFSDKSKALRAAMIVFLKMSNQLTDVKRT